MQPILFVWRGYVVHAYPAMLYCALLVSTFLTTYVGQSFGLNADKVAFATVLLVIPALPGTRQLYVAMHWDLFRDDLRRTWNRSDGGMTVYGGCPSRCFQRRCGPSFTFEYWAAAIGMLYGIIPPNRMLLQNCCSDARPTAGTASSRYHRSARAPDAGSVRNGVGRISLGGDAAVGARPADLFRQHRHLRRRKFFCKISRRHLGQRGKSHKACPHLVLLACSALGVVSIGTHAV